jgi:two-component system sensor histidine kinase CpxA
MITGISQADLLERENSSIYIPYLGHTAQRRRVRSADGRSWLVTLTQSRFNVTEFLSYYAWTFLSILLLSWWIAVNLGSPVRKIRLVVEQFGRGDLSARIQSRRTDELGELARAFDQMSDRIQHLLTSERRLLQDISHELRSPLARLSCAIELGRTAESREEAIGRIHKESKRLNSLVGQLLEVASAEGDPAGMRKERIGLSVLLASLLEDCRIEADACNVRFTFTASTESVVNGDRELLRRAMENILRNAIRYAPERTSIDVTLTGAGDVAIIDVRDYGKGVPGELLSDIFKPFFQVENHRGEAGVGLGLALAQRAIGLHQGKVHAENRFPGLLVQVELPAECIASPTVEAGTESQRERVSRRVTRADL